MAGMAEWQKEWQNGRMAEMATYALFMVHTDDDDDDDDDDDNNDTLIFYITDLLLSRKLFVVRDRRTRTPAPNTAFRVQGRRHHGGGMR